MVGMVTVPVPEPSDPTGNVVVPGKVRVAEEDAAVMVNVAFLPETSPVSTVIPVTVMDMDCPGPAVAGSSVSVLGVLENPLEVLEPLRPPLSLTLKVILLLLAPANAPKVGTVVAKLHAPVASIEIAPRKFTSAVPVGEGAVREDVLIVPLLLSKPVPLMVMD